MGGAAMGATDRLPGPDAVYLVSSVAFMLRVSMHAEEGQVLREDRQSTLQFAELTTSLLHPSDQLDETCQPDNIPESIRSSEEVSGWNHYTPISILPQPQASIETLAPPHIISPTALSSSTSRLHMEQARARRTSG